jgi:hypothetical protein
MMGDAMSRFSISRFSNVARTLMAVGGASCMLAACGNSGGGQSNLSTASILGEAPASASGDRPGVTKDDPMARPVQVAWTSARAQKCGFNFDANRLKSSYITYEQGQGADATRLGSIDKTYDMTVGKIKGTIADANTYCTDKQSAAIKSDLTRHLAGNYEPNFPEDKKVAGGGLFGGLEPVKVDKFDANQIWRDLEDRKNGAKKSE